jgi:hypothetical protein
VPASAAIAAINSNATRLLANPVFLRVSSLSVTPVVGDAGGSDGWGGSVGLSVGSGLAAGCSSWACDGGATATLPTVVLALAFTGALIWALGITMVQPDASAAATKHQATGFFMVILLRLRL